MPKHYNLARMTTATTGTGTITLGSAATGFLSFAGAGASNGDTVTYGIEDGANREVGIGVYTASGTTLTRTTILSSTNSGAAISLSGSAQVFSTIAASDLKPWYWSPPLASSFPSLVGTVNLTLTDDPDVGLIINGGTPVSGNVTRAALKSCPAAGTDFTAIARISQGMVTQSYMGIGLVLYESSSGKVAMLMDQVDTGAGLVEVNYQTLTSYNTTPSNLNATSGLPTWFKIQRIGSTLYYYFSYEGKVWNLLMSAAQTAAFTTAPNYIGVGVFYNYSGAANAIGLCDYWSQTW